MARGIISQFSPGLQIVGGPQSDGLVGAWPLAEGGGTVAYDLTGRSNGTKIGAPVSVPGPFGPALSFNGTTQYVNTGSKLNTSTLLFSWSVWFMATAASASANNGTFLLGAVSNSGFGAYVRVINTASLGAYFPTTTGGDSAKLAASLNIFDSKWHFLAIGVNAAGKGWISFDGAVPVLTGTTLTGGWGTPVPIYLAALDNFGANFNFTGQFADYRTYSRSIMQDGTYQSLYTDPLALVRLPRRTYGFLSAVPTSLTPGAGSIALTGAVPTLELDDSLTPGAGSLILTGSAPTLAAGTTLAPNSGSVVLSGHAPELTAGDSLIPIAGAITLIGQVPTLAWDSTLSPGAGSVVISGYAPTIGEGTYLDPGVGSLAFTGYPPTIRTVFARAGGVPNYQYPGEAEPFARDGTTALFDTADRAERRRRRLKESFKALGVVPPDPVPAPASRPDLPPKAPVGPSAQELARAAAADRVVADLKAAAIAAQQKAERIRLDDGDVLLLLAELV